LARASTAQKYAVGLDLARVAPGGPIQDGDRQRRGRAKLPRALAGVRQVGAAGLRRQRGGQSLRFQQRRVDAAGHITQGVHRLVGDGGGLGQPGGQFGGALPGRDRAGQAEFDLQRDQFLLRPVMQVPLQGPAGPVLGGQHPLPGGPQLTQPIAQPRAQPGIGQQQRGLSGQLLDQPAVRAAHSFAGALSK